VTIASYFSGQRTDSDFLFLGQTEILAMPASDVASSYNFGRGISLYARQPTSSIKQYQDAIGFPA